MSDWDTVQLTYGEISAVRSAISSMSPAQMGSTLYDDLVVIASTGYVSAAELLQIKTDLSSVQPTWAMNALRKNVDEFTFMVNAREQQVMNAVVDTALARGWTPKRLSQEISQTFADGYHVLDDQGNVTRTIASDVWSTMVARTELSRAQTLGQVDLYRSAGVEKVIWVTTQGANVCDLCSGAEGDVMPLGEVFDSVGVAMPPAHPACCCCLTPADADLAYDPQADSQDQAA